MVFAVRWSEHAVRQLERLNKKDAKRIFESAEGIKEDPYRHVRRLAGRPLYRLRVGSYRILVSIEGNKMLVFVVEIGHRRNIYKN